MCSTTIKKPKMDKKVQFVTVYKYIKAHDIYLDIKSVLLLFYYCFLVLSSGLEVPVKVLVVFIGQAYDCCHRCHDRTNGVNVHTISMSLKSNV